VARANILALKASSTDTFFNVGTGVGTSLQELAELLLQLTGADVPIQYEPAGQTFVKQRVGAVDQARKELGFLAQVPLAEGLAELILWRRADKERLVTQE
jgi:UDP-glucose 4-epimerase